MMNSNSHKMHTNEPKGNGCYLDYYKCILAVSMSIACDTVFLPLARGGEKDKWAQTKVQKKMCAGT